MTVKWVCHCSRCNPDILIHQRCLCPAQIVTHQDDLLGEITQWHGILDGHTDGCPIHIKPGCPNPTCGETCIKVFQWPHCDSCGWTAPTIEEEPTTLGPQ